MKGRVAHLDGVFFTDDAELPGYDADADLYGEQFFLTEPDYDVEEWLLDAVRRSWARGRVPVGSGAYPVYITTPSPAAAASA